MYARGMYDVIESLIEAQAQVPFVWASRVESMTIKQRHLIEMLNRSFATFSPNERLILPLPACLQSETKLPV